MSENSVVVRVKDLVTPIVADLGVDLYDLEYAGGTLTVTLDTFPGSEGGITLETLSLATRLISRELDHSDPIPGHYTLEVTSPGLERSLRTPAHFAREIGKTVAIRLRNTAGGDRRVNGVLVAADDDGATVRLDDADLTERVVPYDQIDRARTVFVWGPAPKPGKAPAGKGATKSPASAGKKAATKASGATRPATPAAQSNETDTEAPA